MPRRVEDIVPGDRRSIRDIPITREQEKTATSVSGLKKTSKTVKDEVSIKINKAEQEREKLKPVAKREEHGGELMRRMPMTPPTEHKKKPSRGKKKWLVVALGIVVVIVIAAYIASTSFSRAVFTITPKSIPVTVNSTYVIKAVAPGDLAYDLISVKSSASSTVAATDGPAISTRAEGMVTLYNAYSNSSMRLIAGTRFANDTGLVYRLKNSIIIPGYTKPSGSVVAGSVTTGVIADQAGDQYNISRTDSISDFKILAYKGSAKYDTVYARLSTDVEGGLVGTKKNISSSVLASTTATLRASLTVTLRDRVKSLVPAGYIMFDSSYTTMFSTPVIDSVDKATAQVSVSGILYGIIFKESDFVTKVAGPQAVAAFGGLSYTAPGLQDLKFTIANQKDFSAEKKNTLIINLKGNMKLVGTIPVDELKNKLAGKSLVDSQMVMKTYSPVIESADGELVPPWAKIPSDKSRIVIKVQGI